VFLAERNASALYLMSAGALFTAVCAYMAAKHGTPIVDDAYISFIYARNLARGAGLTYTDGARVEGYTDFACVVMLPVRGQAAP